MSVLTQAHVIKSVLTQARVIKSALTQMVAMNVDAILGIKVKMEIVKVQKNSSIEYLSLVIL